MISAVSFKGTQPAAPQAAPEKKEKKSSAAIGTGVVVGAAAGAGASYAAGWAKKPEYKEVADTFTKSKEFTEAVKDYSGDDKTNADKIIAENKKVDEATKAVDTKLEALFGKDAKDDAEKEIKEIVGKEGVPTLDELKAAAKEETETALKTEEDELKKIQEAADKVEKGKNNDAEPLKLKSKDPADATKEVETTYKISKDADGKVTFTKGTEAPKSLEDHAKAVAEKRTKQTTHKLFADKLGVKADTADTVKIKKSVVKEALGEAAKQVSDEAKTAFEAIKGKLPKKLSGGALAAYAAGGALVGALIAKLAAPKKSEKA